ncbi:MAG TPA: cupredoxin domain-containing protein [Acidimicrobiia bacterium]|nr:cupredoxin domain-containing protein [Acidimicrobiia bacterium]
MRKLLVSVAALAAAAVPATGALAATSAKASSPPVKISGKVNNHGTAPATGGAVTLTQNDYFFSPTFVSVPKGVTSVAVTVTNNGSTTHSFTVPSANITADLNPGATMTFTVPVTGNGVYFYCRFHRSLGMVGAFFTKKGVKISTSPGSGSSTATTSRSSSGGYGY